MGIYDSMTKASSRSGAATRYDGHSVTSTDVLNGSADGIRPDSNIQWTVATPETIHAPTTATIEEAEREELEAIEYGNSVQNGIRMMKARAKKVRDNVKLVLAHRGYQGTVVKATVAIAGANKGLADKLQDARAAFAGMGHSLDQKTQTIDHRVEVIKARYQQRRS
jgi:hypothetical protein